MALTAALMVGVLGVMPQTQTLVGEARDATAKDPDASALIRLLTEDLDHAGEVVTSEPDRLVLRSYASLDTPDRDLRHEPVEVTYRFDEIAGRRWLVRVESPMRSVTNRDTSRALLGAGFDAFHLTSTRFRTGSPPVVEPSEDAGGTRAGNSGSEESSAADNASTDPDTPSEATAPPSAEPDSGRDADSRGSGDIIETPSGQRVQTSLKTRVADGRVSYWVDGNWYFYDYLPPRNRAQVRRLAPPREEAPGNSNTQTPADDSRNRPGDTDTEVEVEAKHGSATGASRDTMLRPAVPIEPQPMRRMWRLELERGGETSVHPLTIEGGW